MAPWCCFTPLAQRPSLDGAAAVPAGDLVGEVPSGPKTNTTAQSPRQRGSVVVVKTKLTSEVEQIETKASSTLGTEAAGAADNFDEEPQHVHASRHSQPRVSAQAPSRSSTASGINMLCVPPIVVTSPEQLQEEEQDIVAPLPSSPSMRMEHSTGHSSTPVIVSTFSISGQAAASPRGPSYDRVGTPVQTGLATAGLLSPTNIQLGIARMRATAFDVLTGAVKTQDVAKAYQQMGQSPWGIGGTANMAELLHGGMMYAGLHTGSPAVVGGRQNLPFASPIAASSVLAGSLQASAQGLNTNDLAQQKSPTAYCPPLQVPHVQYTSSPHASQQSGTSCQSPGISSLAGSAASPYGGLQTPSSKPPRVPTRSSAGTIIMPQSADTVVNQGPAQGSSPAAAAIAPSSSPRAVQGSAGVLTSPRDKIQLENSARSVSGTPQSTAALLPVTSPTTYAQLHNVSAASGSRHAGLSGSEIPSSNVTPQGQQRPEGSNSGTYHQGQSQRSHHHHAQQQQYIQQPVATNPYGFVPVHSLTPQALSRALQGSTALGRSGSMRAVSSRSHSLMSNTSVTSQRRSAKGTPQQQQPLLSVGWDSRSPATRGVPGRPYQAQTSKLGSASSRVALSGLLSRGSNMSTASMDKGLNVDFRPRWR